jgi:hypothetical protein
MLTYAELAGPCTAFGANRNHQFRECLSYAPAETVAKQVAKDGGCVEMIFRDVEKEK